MMWYEMTGRDSDVVVSSRVRLARNLVDYPFGDRLNAPSAKEIIEKVKNAFDSVGGYRFTDFEGLDPVRAIADKDKHKVSYEFASKKGPHALIESDKDQIYVMLLEEDHVRIQSIKSGLALEEAYNSALEADEILDSSLNVAFDERLGYLTHCPTNLGTGMRASVMMFLPALTYNRGIRTLQNQLGKIGLTVRGMSGEGSGADGCLYQISNQVTLGMSETEILSKLTGICEKIIEQERSLRERMKREDDGRLADRVMRSYGTMLYAVLMDSEELSRLYADVRLGAAMGIIDSLPLHLLDKMLVCGMAGVLMSENENIRAPRDRDKARAEMVRQVLSGAAKTKN